MAVGTSITCHGTPAVSYHPVLSRRPTVPICRTTRIISCTIRCPTITCSRRRGSRARPGAAARAARRSPTDGTTSIRIRPSAPSARTVRRPTVESIPCDRTSGSSMPIGSTRPSLATPRTASCRCKQGWGWERAAACLQRACVCVSVDHSPSRGGEQTRTSSTTTLQRLPILSYPIVSVVKYVFFLFSFVSRCLFLYFLFCFLNCFSLCGFKCRYYYRQREKEIERERKRRRKQPLLPRRSVNFVAHCITGRS